MTHHNRAWVRALSFEGSFAAAENRDGLSLDTKPFKYFGISLLMFVFDEWLYFTKKSKIIIRNDTKITTMTTLKNENSDFIMKWRILGYLTKT